MSNKAKVAFSITHKHNNWLEAKAEDMGINKSAMLSICIDNYIKSQDLTDAIKDMGPMLKQFQQLQQVLETKETK